MKYLLLFAADEDAWLSLSEAERNDAVQRIGRWYRELAGSGRIVHGHRLVGREGARTVRLGKAGRSERPRVTDGPFVEGAEVIGSYAIVEVSGLDEALEIAKSWPAGGSVEVRPVTE